MSIGHELRRVKQLFEYIEVFYIHCIMFGARRAKRPRNLRQVTMASESKIKNSLGVFRYSRREALH